ncbi:hypothetical protein PR048_027198 [Dryococelus australis]|uniref:Uncharacterized protein n=1 Tax=Dryococelus australis TaxID=614101 RepID=A0ABQ9GG82_9NEOP|nr:hypothetical protein PR048_027198 [Dryococelus australis]
MTVDSAPRNEYLICRVISFALAAGFIFIVQNEECEQRSPHVTVQIRSEGHFPQCHAANWSARSLTSNGPSFLCTYALRVRTSSGSPNPSWHTPDPSAPMTRREINFGSLGADLPLSALQPSSLLPRAAFLRRRDKRSRYKGGGASKLNTARGVFTRVAMAIRQSRFVDTRVICEPPGTLLRSRPSSRVSTAAANEIKGKILSRARHFVPYERLKVQDRVVTCFIGTRAVTGNRGDAAAFHKAIFIQSVPVTPIRERAAPALGYRVSLRHLKNDLNYLLRFSQLDSGRGEPSSDRRLARREERGERSDQQEGNTATANIRTVKKSTTAGWAIGLDSVAEEVFSPYDAGLDGHHKKLLGRPPELLIFYTTAKLKVLVSVFPLTILLFVLATRDTPTVLYNVYYWLIEQGFNYQEQGFNYQEQGFNYQEQGFYYQEQGCPIPDSHLRKSGDPAGKFALVGDEQANRSATAAPFSYFVERDINFQSLAGSPDVRIWESCRTKPLVGGFSLGIPRPPPPPAISYRRRSILTSITPFGSQNLAVNRATQTSSFIHSLTHSSAICKTNIAMGLASIHALGNETVSGGWECDHSCGMIAPRKPDKGWVSVGGGSSGVGQKTTVLPGHSGEGGRGIAGSKPPQIPSDYSGWLSRGLSDRCPPPFEKFAPPIYMYMSQLELQYNSVGNIAYRMLAICVLHLRICLSYNILRSDNDRISNVDIAVASASRDAGAETDGICCRNL